MFEVGFSELCMVALVALVVIGPEKLPAVARLAGFWIAKARSIISHVQAEISEELQADEIRQLLAQQQTSLDAFRVTQADTAPDNLLSTSNEAQSSKAKHYNEELLSALPDEKA